MKIRLLSCAGVPFLFLVLALICPVQCAAQTGPSVTVLIDAPKYDSDKNIYRGSFTVNDPIQISRLLYVVEDADTGTVQIDPTEVNLGGLRTRPFELDGARFKAEHKYLLTVRAVDRNGNLIPRSSDNFGQDSGEQYILASKEFTHQPAAPPVFTFTIKSHNVDRVDRDNSKLTLRLALPDGFVVEKYDGFIVDDNGQRVGVIPGTLYVPQPDGSGVTVLLPEAMAKATEEHQYKVTLRLVTESNQQDEQTYEFTLPGVIPPGPLQIIGEALKRTPVIALAIAIVIAVVAMVFILSGKRQKNYLPPFGRPPQDHTLPGNMPVRRNRLRVRVVQSPGKSRGMEKTMKDFPFTIGRGEDCHIRIDDSHVSRKHLEISLRDGYFFVTDPNSTHGTFINHERLRVGAATPIPGPISVQLGDRTVIELDTGE